MAQARKVSRAFGNVTTLQGPTVLNGQVNNFTTLTGATTLVPSNSGSYYTLAGVTGAGFVVTLPAATVSSGFTATFIVATGPASANNYVISTNTGGNLALRGTAANDTAGLGILSTAGNQLTLVASNSIRGDEVIVNCDGTNYYCAANVAKYTGLTVA